MDLIVWRHADAEDGWPDHARVLTNKGLKQADAMAKWLKPRLPEDVRILVSPARRTQQTAQALGLPFETCEAVEPGRNATELLSAAGWPNKEGVTLIVGHQPTLGEVASLLLSGFISAWTIKKGSVWWFTQRTDDHTELVAAIAPSMLDSHI